VRLLSSGLSKIAQKVVEEATEVAIDAVQRQRTAVINESVDLFYNLIVVWDELGITPADLGRNRSAGKGARNGREASKGRS
jgi:phosphoribosyl-ATP pyrophosphohydrolase